jgi:hypothetical protein
LVGLSDFLPFLILIIGLLSDGKKYVALLPDIYGDIKDMVGVQKAPTPDNTD